MTVKKVVINIFFILATNWGHAQQTGHWGDQGNGNYRNPVIAADYSDPDVIRVGTDYYMVSSTFESYPGVTILHSSDLVNWNTVGAALTDLAAADSGFSYKKMNRYNEGVYAPTIHYHDKKFYIFVNLHTDGFYVATANHAEGPWKSQYLKDKNGRPLKIKGWTDPCAFWDDDGKAYLASSRPGRQYWFSYLFQMSPDGEMLLDADSSHMAQSGIIYKYPDGGTVVSPYHSSEGNRIFKRNGYYYLQHIEFTKLGHGEGTYIYRSKNIYGTLPDGSPGKPGNPGGYELFTIDTVSDRAHLRLPGQGGYVTTPDGRWFWMAQFTRDGSDGRSPCLLPVTWVDDWPIIGTDVKDLKGDMAWQLPKPITGFGPQLPFSGDKFNSAKLGTQWQWNHQPANNKWSLTERKGWLRLHAFAAVNNGGFFQAGNTISLRHLRSDSAVETIKMDITDMADGQKAGLVHFNGGKQYALIGVEKTGGSYHIIYEEGGIKTAGQKIESPKIIYLRSFALFNDNAIFSYSFNGKDFVDFGKIYILKPGNFRGDMVGIFTFNNFKGKGFVDIDWFRLKIINR